MDNPHRRIGGNIELDRGWRLRRGLVGARRPNRQGSGKNEDEAAIQRGKHFETSMINH
jgi:hypothetical protein